MQCCDSNLLLPPLLIAGILQQAVLTQHGTQAPGGTVTSVHTCSAANTELDAGAWQSRQACVLRAHPAQHACIVASQDIGA